MRVVVAAEEMLAGRVLEFVLREGGHTVEVVAGASAALAAVVGRETDAVLTGTALPGPGGDGYTLCKELRGRRYRGPLLVVSAAGTTEAKLRAFEVGADDYLVAPYDPAELLARVGALVRRCRTADRQGLGTVIKAGDAELSLGELAFRRDGRPAETLTPVELRLLECLMRNQGITIGRETLVERVWGYDFIGDSNRVDVYIRRLRKKVEDQPDAPRYLHTVRGLGYAFRPPSESQFGTPRFPLSGPGEAWPARGWVPIAAESDPWLSRQAGD